MTGGCRQVQTELGAATRRAPHGKYTARSAFSSGCQRRSTLQFQSIVLLMMACILMARFVLLEWSRRRAPGIGTQGSAQSLRASQPFEQLTQSSGPCNSRLTHELVDMKLGGRACNQTSHRFVVRRRRRALDHTRRLADALSNRLAQRRVGSYVTNVGCGRLTAIRNAQAILLLLL